MLNILHEYRAKHRVTPVYSIVCVYICCVPPPPPGTAVVYVHAFHRNPGHGRAQHVTCCPRDVHTTNIITMTLHITLTRSIHHRILHLAHFIH